MVVSVVRIFFDKTETTETTDTTIWKPGFIEEKACPKFNPRPVRGGIESETF